MGLNVVLYNLMRDEHRLPPSPLIASFLRELQ